MNKLQEAVKYMISVWDEVTGKTWRERPDHVQQKFINAEPEIKAKFYTADDMKALLHFMADEGFFRSYGFWYSGLPKYKNKKHTIDQLIKLWEESK